jgi:hypothetical protein
VQRAAVADDEVRAGCGGHREPVLLGAPLGDEVEHDVGTVAVGEPADLLELAAVGNHGVVRAQLFCELERVGVAVDHDDPGRGERG